MAKRPDDRALARKIDAATRWPAAAVLVSKRGAHTETLYRTLYARLAPREAPLPPCVPFAETALSARGDGMIETSEWVTAGGDKDTWYHLVVEDTAYVVTCFRDYERQANDDDWYFDVRAPDDDALARAIAALTELLPDAVRAPR